MVGSTEPRSAIPGTIRSDFASVESYPNANNQGRAVRNLIHASDSVDNAKKEIKTWFDEEEVHDYKRPGDEKIFG
jgi:nucleoside-diphosphate kinase